VYHERDGLAGWRGRRWYECGILKFGFRVDAHVRAVVRVVVPDAVMDRGCPSDACIRLPYNM
jgi:hypothetical protein